MRGCKCCLATSPIRIQHRGPGAHSPTPAHYTCLCFSTDSMVANSPAHLVFEPRPLKLGACFEWLLRFVPASSEDIEHDTAVVFVELNTDREQKKSEVWS
jgi:hypothetical protein